MGRFTRVLYLSPQVHQDKQFRETPSRINSVESPLIETFVKSSSKTERFKVLI